MVFRDTDFTLKSTNKAGRSLTFVDSIISSATDCTTGVSQKGMWILADLLYVYLFVNLKIMQLQCV